jgi:hypothetical protein
VILFAISFPQCYVAFFMFQFFQFYLIALLSLPLASFSEHSLSVSLLALFPATEGQKGGKEGRKDGGREGGRKGGRKEGRKEGKKNSLFSI